MRQMHLPKLEQPAISPMVSIGDLLSESPARFEQVTRLDARTYDFGRSGDFFKDIYYFTVIRGEPLIVDNWHKSPEWNAEIFSMDWLYKKYSDLDILVRDVDTAKDSPTKLGDYISYLSSSARQGDEYSRSKHARTDKRTLYAKDLSCFSEWDKLIRRLVPETIQNHGPGDLSSFLPSEFRAITQLVYFGNEGTFTPAHKDMCATIGQNVMVDQSADGSSVWFVTRSSDRNAVKNYMASLGHNIDLESYFLALDELREAPFTVYVAEQRRGDMVLVPSLAMHQVWNRGDYSIKLAWSRITVDTLQLALEECLPQYRLVSRGEHYRTKATVHVALTTLSNKLLDVHASPSPSSIGTYVDEFISLFKLFRKFLVEEALADNRQVLTTDDKFIVICSYCKADIFNRFLSCSDCKIDRQGWWDCFDICLDCYARGRSCLCADGTMKFVEQTLWSELMEDYERFRRLISECTGVQDVTAPFDQEVAKLGRKSTAMVCSKLLSMRPFSEHSNKVSSSKIMKGQRALRPKVKGFFHATCHMCRRQHDTWRTVLCKNDNCGKRFCFSSLWRAFDLDPHNVLSQYNWICPSCQCICNCNACLRTTTKDPYIASLVNVQLGDRRKADSRGREWLLVGQASNAYWGMKMRRLEDQKRTNVKNFEHQHGGAGESRYE
ncbi:hypothetical protein V1517DRAFT_203012 [Lipomyces orientalis]|uniref:Uncharacterized protein n=1 Tax=Lipomyces orientalis TaxID=1233043 RepID=A0ACC3TW80_9ASCO